MKTVHEISDLTGLSIRTLQYYDNIGLLKPSQYSASGYRLYDDDSLTVLQHRSCCSGNWNFRLRI